MGRKLQPVGSKSPNTSRPKQSSSEIFGNISKGPANVAGAWRFSVGFPVVVFGGVVTEHSTGHRRKTGGGGGVCYITSGLCIEDL